MSFPSEFPGLAVQQVLAFVTKKDEDKARLALAAYELLGYGLKTYFGDAKYLMQSDHELIARASRFTEEDFKKVVANLPQYMDAAAKGYQMYQAGTPIWLILIKLAVQYGPELVAIFAKFFA